MFEFLDAKTLYVIFHLFALAIGAGGAFMGDVMFFTTMRDYAIDEKEFRFLKLAGNVVWGGMLLFLISGVLLVSLDPSTYFDSPKFLAKMVIVGVIIANGLAFHMIHIPRMRRWLGEYLPSSRDFRDKSRGMFISGAVSAVSWSFAIILGAIDSIPHSIWLILLVYVLVLCIAVGASLLTRKKILKMSPSHE